MKLKISDVIDKYKGQKCIIIGHGPSLNPYLSRLNKLKNKGYTIIGCNNWNEFYPDCPPHYWVMANNVDNSVNQLPIINSYKATWVYADTVDLTDQEWLEKNIQTDFLPYDQRHYGGKECSSCHRHGCVKYFDQNRLTIQEELQKYTGYDKHYEDGSTVAVHMLAFGIIMGFSEIYIMGVDLDYHVGYASSKTGRVVPELAHFDIYRESILSDVQTIADSANKIGTKVYNTNNDSCWKIFDYKEIV